MRCRVVHLARWFVTCVALLLAACNGGSGNSDAPTEQIPAGEARVRVFEYANLDEFSSRHNLTLCEPLRFVGADVKFEESIALAPVGADVVYSHNTCLPDIDDQSRLAVRAPDGSVQRVDLEQSAGDVNHVDEERIVWTPARAGEDNSVMSASFLNHDATIECDDPPYCSVLMTVKPKEWWTARSEYMIGTREVCFIDSVPLRDFDGQIAAPWRITADDRGVASCGRRLVPDEARRLATMINDGSLH